MFNLEEELKKLPGKPGVYLMHDKTDEIIYVGKAISLKNRVRQYFQKSRHVTPKIQRMIDRIAWFEYIVTDSELEALVLECNLIKEHSPRYNTMLKDGKSYPFLKATVSEAYPRLLFARQMKRDGCKYFGVISQPSLSHNFCPSLTAPAGQASTHLPQATQFCFSTFAIYAERDIFGVLKSCDVRSA